MARLTALAMLITLASIAYTLVLNCGWQFCAALLFQIISAVYFGAAALSFFYGVLYLTLSFVSFNRQRCRTFAAITPSVSVIVPAYNESRVILRTVRTLLLSDYEGDFEIIVIDDGSYDDTAVLVETHFSDNANVKIIRQTNRGKSAALNTGIIAARGDIIVAIDADTLIHPEAITKLARHFGDDRVGAVSGNMQVGNPVNKLTRLQRAEYLIANNIDRRALELLNSITVVPGAIGAFRKNDLIRLHGFSSETLAEDSDLTIRLLIAGKKIVYEPDAIALTEVPQTLRDLKKQRFRWSFGKLQALWKYRSVVFNPRYGLLGLFCLPTQLVGQLILPCVSWVSTTLPLLILVKFFTDSIIPGDIATLSIQSQAILWVYLLMAVLGLVTNIIAMGLERETSFSILLDIFFPMNIAFKCMMTYVTVTSVFSALSGRVVGWNKLQRMASVSEFWNSTDLYSPSVARVSQEDTEVSPA